MNCFQLLFVIIIVKSSYQFKLPVKSNFTLSVIAFCRNCIDDNPGLSFFIFIKKN